MTVNEEWKKIIAENHSIYIYGAGKIGKKIFNLVKNTENAALKVKGFLVSDLPGNPPMIDELPVMLPENLSDRTSLVLVSVTDIYQDMIVQNLNELGFVNVVVAYKYSFIEDDASSDLPKVIQIDTNELLLCQYRDGVFNRYDVAVRLLAIENYFGKNIYGFDLYKKMQKRRAGDEAYGEISTQRYAQLIQSYEKMGYDENSELVIDEKLHLKDGSHRLALAIYFGVSRLKVRIIKKEKDNYYGKSWFEKYFSREECALIKKKVFEIESNCAGTIKGILWPSAVNFFDEIVDVIKQQYLVTNICDFVLDFDKFTKIVHDIYQIDSIAEWKINTKLKYMTPFSPYRIRIFDIDMKNPKFRLNNTKDQVLSDKGARLKEKIREMYKEKITGYFPDIIFHTADGFYQSRYIEKLFSEII